MRMLALVLPALLLAAPPRPVPARIKGLHRPAPLTTRGMVRDSLADMKGAVVVVEENALPPWPEQFGRYGFFRIYGPGPDRPELPVAPWMDTSRVVSGGNPIALVYPLQLGKW